MKSKNNQTNIKTNKIMIPAVGEVSQLDHPNLSENNLKINTRKIGRLNAIISLNAIIPKPLIGRSLSLLRNHFP